MINLYCRRRIAAIKFLADFLPNERTHKNTDRKLLVSYGYIPEHLGSRIAQLISKSEIKDDSPLSFKEITSYNTFFVMHPEKVAGKEVVTTSIHFPIKIVASKEDVQKMIRNAIGNKNTKKSDDKDDLERKKRIFVAKAKALKVRLLLLKMGQFKIGDKVKVKEAYLIDNPVYKRCNVGTVVGFDVDFIVVESIQDLSKSYFNDDEIELIELDHNTEKEQDNFSDRYFPLLENFIYRIAKVRNKWNIHTSSFRAGEYSFNLKDGYIIFRDYYFFVSDDFHNDYWFRMICNNVEGGQKIISVQLDLFHSPSSEKPGLFKSVLLGYVDIGIQKERKAFIDAFSELSDSEKERLNQTVKNNFYKQINQTTQKDYIVISSYEYNTNPKKYYNSHSISKYKKQ